MNTSKITFGAIAFSTLTATSGFASASETGSLRMTGSKCLDDPGWVTTNGTHLQIYDCNNAATQEWVLEGDGTIRLAANTNKCVTLEGTAMHSPIELWDCNGAANQQWTLTADGTLHGYGNMCVDDPWADTDDGTQFQSYSCHGGSNQQFTVDTDLPPPIVDDQSTAFYNEVSSQGTVAVALYANGDYDFQGTFTDTGFFDLNYAIVCLASDGNGVSYSLVDTGLVHGYESSWLGGPMRASFSTSGNSQSLQNQYWAMASLEERKGGAVKCSFLVNPDYGSLAADINDLLTVAGVVVSLISG